MIYHFGECAFDTSLYSVQRGGQTIRLRPKVFRVCLYLLEHRDRIVSREELCAQMWPGRFVNQATLEGVIRSVREALGDSGRSQGVIQTVRGYGYRFVASIQEGTAEEVKDEVPRTGMTASSTDVGPAPQMANMPGIVESAEVWHGAPGSAPPGQMRAWQPDADGRALDSHVATARREPHAPARSGPVRWRLASVGAGLAMVAFMLLGAFGLWWGIGHEAIEVLDRSRVAVLPFVDLSTEADQAYFADGMIAELIAQLSQTPGVTVIARTSVMKYKGSLKDVATIGRELRVGSILEGSIRKMDQQVRVSVQLIDVASQGHLWSQEYTRELAGVFATQSDIATHLAQGLKVQLTPLPTYNRLENEARFIAVVQKIRPGQ